MVKIIFSPFTLMLHRPVAFQFSNNLRNYYCLLRVLKWNKSNRKYVYIYIYIYMYFFFFCFSVYWASLVAQMLKHLPATWETRVQSLGREDPLEKEMSTHSSILAWRISWREEPGGLQSMGLQGVKHDWMTSLSLSVYMLSCSVMFHNK